MEFDKSRCYSALNADELKPGDRVIVADDLATLKCCVKDNSPINTLSIIGKEDCIFRFSVKDNCVSFAFAYLVERAENCTNCGEGRWDAEHKKIFCDPVNCGNGNVVFRNHEIEVCEYWKPITKQKAEKHTDYNHCEDAKKAYVCAMTNACPEKHYRPFKNIDELIKVWIEKSKQVHSDYSLTMPYIWVRLKECNKGGLLITYFGEDEVKTDVGFLTMSKLLNAYTFTDGSVCGVEE